MVWIRLFISCLVFLSVAGAISCGLVRVARSFHRIENPGMLSVLYKTTLMLYWLPVSFICVCIPRIAYENGVKAYTGEFVCSSVSSMTVVFNILGAAWLAGFLLSVARDGGKARRLTKLVRGNVPVQDARYLSIFEECRRQTGIAHVTLSQNDLLHSPVTAGLVRKQIILPFADYTDTELRMIYDHEMTHIRNRDLLWRIFALVTSWIHWFNPLLRVHLRDLDCVQEMICDLSIALDSTHYTKKEYAAFLVRLTDEEAVNAYTTALAENHSQTTRRIETMAGTKKFVKPKRWMTGLGCVCLAAASLLPATAVSAEAARLQEDWMRAEEVETIAEPQDHWNPSIEEYGYDDGSVVEIDGSQDIAPYSSTVDLDKTINANTRYIYQYKDKSAGDIITIVTSCADSSVTYKIGIKNKKTGAMTSISVTGRANTDFKISESGSYSAFVENNNNFPIKVEGVAVY